MKINKKLLATAGLFAAVIFMAMSPPQEEKPKFKNLKVLPKNITDKQLDNIMEEWEHALGARCSFCHVRNEETKKMDFALDGKPEKEMARHMYKMTAAINKKYFSAKKDSLGMMMETGVNCNTCHRGVSHPEVVSASASAPRRNGPPPGAAPANAPQNGTPPVITPPPGNK